MKKNLFNQLISSESNKSITLNIHGDYKTKTKKLYLFIFVEKPCENWTFSTQNKFRNEKKTMYFHNVDIKMYGIQLRKKNSFGRTNISSVIMVEWSYHRKAFILACLKCEPRSNSKHKWVFLWFNFSGNQKTDHKTNYLKRDGDTHSFWDY